MRLKNDMILQINKAAKGDAAGLVEFLNLIGGERNGQTEILHLGVKNDNINAINLYKKMGFHEVGIHKNFFKIEGYYYDEILMDLYL